VVSHRESLIVGEKDKESVRRQAGVSHYRRLGWSWGRLRKPDGEESWVRKGRTGWVGVSVFLLEKGGKLPGGALQSSAGLGQLKAKKMMEEG
jgi:hypothetical protein